MMFGFEGAGAAAPQENERKTVEMASDNESSVPNV
jgi:hypothetical protein